MLWYIKKEIIIITYNNNYKLVIEKRNDLFINVVIVLEN